MSNKTRATVAQKPTGLSKPAKVAIWIAAILLVAALAFGSFCCVSIICCHATKHCAAGNFDGFGGVNVTAVSSCTANNKTAFDFDRTLCADITAGQDRCAAISDNTGIHNKFAVCCA